ncbi:hypothetical protein B0H15DRAFT_289261 [Mycena belliarum]|uniref:Uncharacterized protein n=1 Tax=Mycena belliarum TaxID=1033014 RepID=A0AAD6U3S5_9AGAR|nr:hypothetical protein B0H15DRAFT_289261 [Mycena belliae]
MSLQQQTPDEWTPTGIKSTFWIVVPASTDPGPSPVCGLGWRFSCSANLDSSSTSTVFVGADGGTLPAWRIAVFFDPHLVSSAGYGRLSFSVDAPHLVIPKDANNTTTFTLPDKSRAREAQIATFIYIVDKTRKIVPPTVTITVKLPASLGLSIPRSIGQRLERTLIDTMHGKEVVDVKFYALTRRSAGYVGRPQGILAKASLLQGYSDSLDVLILGGGFTESRLVDLDEEQIDTELLEDYDYMSDSDLDDDEDGPDEEETSSLATPANSDNNASAVNADPFNTPLPWSAPATPVSLPHYTPTRRMGRVVVIRGTAFKTWKALLYYLYTSKLSFSTEFVTQAIQDEYEVPRSSAKSMFRLADKLGLDELKSLSLSSIRGRLTKENIIREVFCKFTSMYPEVQDIEVEFLLKNFKGLEGELNFVLEGLCKGDRPHCADVLRKIVAVGVDGSATTRH